ncbi:MAG TPA: S8 family peptidase, partial [Gemmataceae bacterium]|nr:S8 family peptidase [Gemmataceae bacterium]
MPQTARFVFLLVTVVLGASAPSLASQQAKVRLLVTPTNDIVPFNNKLSTRLRPLDALGDTECTLVGLTRKGEMVIEMPKGDVNSAMRSLAKEGAKAEQTSEEPPRRTRTLLVRYTDRDAARKELTDLGYEILEDYEPGSFFRVVPKNDKGQLRTAAVTKLGELAAVDHVELERTVHLPQMQLKDKDGFKADTTGTPNDEYWSELWGLRTINAPEAWKTVREAPDVIVAVLDTGVDYNHEDLKPNMWINPKPDPVKKDVHGYDFVGKTGNPMDPHGHGTQCAGIIGAVGNNKKGVTGVAWKVQIMALKCLDREGHGANTDVIKAIAYAVEHKANIINASFTDTVFDQLVYDAIKRAADQGILFIAAAGNDDNNNDNANERLYPCSYGLPNVISVMAVNQKDVKATFPLGGSGFGKDSVHLAAPGIEIMTCHPNNLYKKTEGTSMAAPYVAGAAALVWAHPTYAQSGYRTIRKLLFDNARKLDAKGNPLRLKCLT